MNNTANTQSVNCTSVITQVNMKILLFEVGTVIRLGGLVLLGTDLLKNTQHVMHRNAYKTLTHQALYF